MHVRAGGLLKSGGLARLSYCAADIVLGVRFCLWEMPLPVDVCDILGFGPLSPAGFAGIVMPPCLFYKLVHLTTLASTSRQLCNTHSGCFTCYSVHPKMSKNVLHFGTEGVHFPLMQLLVSAS